MAKKKRAPRDPEPAESRAAEFATVAWMLSVMTTLVCESISACVWLLAPADAPQGLLFARYLLFCSLVAAVVSLLLQAVVFKTRHEKPPRSITAFAVVVAVLPLVAIFF